MVLLNTNSKRYLPYSNQRLLYDKRTISAVEGGITWDCCFKQLTITKQYFNTLYSCLEYILPIIAYRTISVHKSVYGGGCLEMVL